jgi:transposase-like protein
MSNTPEPKITRQMTLQEFDRLFPNEDACKTCLAASRWPKAVSCPRCGNEKVYALKTRPFNWVCKKCGDTPYRFSVLVGTIFENTNYKLLIWFKVLYLMLTSKKGISALQIHRMIGSGSYRTAWFICHRLRAGLSDPDFRKLMGIVEVDETYIGGLNRNRHWNKKQPGRGPSGKTTVIGAISRKGNVVCKIIEDTSMGVANKPTHSLQYRTRLVWSPRMKRLAIRSCIKHSRTSTLTTKRTNTCAAKSIPTISNRSGRCSSVA